MGDSSQLQGLHQWKKVRRTSFQLHGIQDRQVPTHRLRLGIIRPERRPPDRQRPLEGRARPRQVPHLDQQLSQVTGPNRNRYAVGANDLFIKGERALKGSTRAGVITHQLQMPSELVPQDRGALQAGGFGDRDGRLDMRAQGEEGIRKAGLVGPVGQRTQRASESKEGLPSARQGADVSRQ